MRSAVWLRLYDISNGKAAAWSPLVLGKRIEAVWHTGVHVYGREYFYGRGIESLLPREVEDLYDMQIVEEQLLGYTKRTQPEFEVYLRKLDPAFTPVTYDLTRWNCNHFSDACVRFLLDGVGISDGILELPETVRSTFVGAVVLKLFELLSRNRNVVGGDRGASSESIMQRNWTNTRSSLSAERSPMAPRRNSSIPRAVAPPPILMASSISAPVMTYKRDSSPHLQHSDESENNHFSAVFAGIRKLLKK